MQFSRSCKKKFSYIKLIVVNAISFTNFTTFSLSPPNIVISFGAATSFGES